MKYLFFIFLGLIFPLQTCGKLLDGVVAVVDKEIILLSELNDITYLSMVKERQSIQDSLFFNETRRRVLNSMIDDKVLLARAKVESVSVTNAEVNELIDRQINSLAERYGSMEAFGRELKEKYGLTLVKLKKQYRKDIRDNLIKQKFREKLFRKTSVTYEEVKEFYRAYKDSLPKGKASINLSHIMLYAKPDAKLEKKARKKIENIKARIDNGDSFEKLAFEFSEGPSAKDSGDIGFFRKGGIGLPEFENAAFSLNPGEISKIVQSKAGFHIIKMLEKNDRQIHVRHILILNKPSEEIKNRIVAKLDSIRNIAKDSSDFARVASVLSEDDNTRQKGGYLGWYARDRLSSNYLKAINNLKEGQISKPVKIGNGYHIFRINHISDSRRLTLKDDYSLIEKLAAGYKERKMLEEKLKSWRSGFYIKDYLNEFGTSYNVNAINTQSQTNNADR